MLARYRIVRGKRPTDDPLPTGIRQDTRKHTKHCLRPEADMVAGYLSNPSAAAWSTFSKQYLRLLNRRFTDNPEPFQSLADLAMTDDVYLGCSCPTAKNPDVNCCHTVLALRFMAERFPQLTVQFPS